MISKSKVKKIKRYEVIIKKNKYKKQKLRELKISRAKAKGRDLDLERRQQYERTISGEGRKRRDMNWSKRIVNVEASFKICLDCSFGDYMSIKEIGSLSQQIRYCYSVNKNSPNPVYFSVSNLCGHLYDRLGKVSGFPTQWLRRAFSFSENNFIGMYPQQSKIVYLTSDSKRSLDEVVNDEVYVIGGLVDRNRLKGITERKARDLGIRTAKLPIGEYMQLLTANVLTCNHVFEILLKYRQNGNNWNKAFLDVVPRRKEGIKG